MGKVCSNCHFDPEWDSLVAEGAPCGVYGCMSFTCCNKTWIEHCKRCHHGYWLKNWGYKSYPERIKRKFLRFFNTIRYKCLRKKGVIA